MTIWLAVLAGSALGFVLARGDFCFHSTWRSLFATPRDSGLARAYLVLLIVATPIVQLMMATGVIDPYVPPFAPAAAIVGGLIFGIGMVIAQTCVSGMFYKLGAGMLGMVVAILSWGIGDVITWRGPLKGLRESLNETTVTTTSDGVEEAATITSALGPVGLVLVLAALGGAMWLLRGSPIHRVELGVVTALVIVVAWVLVALHDGDYPYGTSGVPTQIWNELVNDGGGSMWIPLALVALIPGALLAAKVGGTLWVRGESLTRFVQLAAGGLVMGVGAAIAGGCNLGHSMVGVPLLSIGSIVSTLAIIAGVFVGGRVAAVLAGRSTESAVSPH